MDLSIIVVNYNTADSTINCIKSILHQSFTHTIEIIVVDNKSVDDSVPRIKVSYPEVRLIENIANLGFAAANNRGIAVSKGRYLLLLNSDTELLDDGLDTLVDMMDQEPTIMLLTCRLLNADGTIQPSLRRFPTLVSAFMDSLMLTPVAARVPLLQRFTLLEQDHSMQHDVQQVPGAFMMIRRDVLETIGKLDEEYFMYYEDVDFCLRLKKAGYRIVFQPSVEVRHFGGGTFRGHRIAATEQRLVSKVRYFKKHHSHTTWIVKILVSFELLIRTAYALGLATLKPRPTIRAGDALKAFILGLKTSWSV
jgi:GT2 family glycosyltransferase